MNKDEQKKIYSSYFPYKLEVLPRQTIILIAQNKTWQHIALTWEELTIKE